MKNLLILTLFAILMVSCAPASTAVPVSTVTYTPPPTITYMPELTTTFTPEPTATFTSEPTATFTSEPTATPTPRLLDLQVFAFWDYNGNGKYDEEEYPLEGIITIIENKQCTTVSDGTCILGQFQEGTTLFILVSDPINNMGYFFPDTNSYNKLPYQSQHIVTIEGVFYVPLGIGFLTYPFTCDKNSLITIGWGVDGHMGLDFDVPNGTPILASAPGKVNWTGTLGNGAIGVTLDHFGGFQTHYGHLDSVAPGISPDTEVSRGQVIGFSGNSGVTGTYAGWYHLHFSLYDTSAGTNSPPDINPNSFWTTGSTSNSRLTCQP